VLLNRVIHNHKELLQFAAEQKALSWDKPMVVTLKSAKRPRSLPQNKLYWSWLRCIEQETGNASEDMHEFFKQRFLGFEGREILGETIAFLPSSSKLDSARFGEYLEKVRLFAIEKMNVFLPYPTDEAYTGFAETYQ